MGFKAPSKVPTDTVCMAKNCRIYAVWRLCIGSMWLISEGRAGCFVTARLLARTLVRSLAPDLDTLPSLLLMSWLSPCVVDAAVAVCVNRWRKAYTKYLQYNT